MRGRECVCFSLVSIATNRPSVSLYLFELGFRAQSSAKVRVLILSHRGTGFAPKFGLGSSGRCSSNFGLESLVKVHFYLGIKVNLLRVLAMTSMWLGPTRLLGPPSTPQILWQLPNNAAPYLLEGERSWSYVGRFWFLAKRVCN